MELLVLIGEQIPVNNEIVKIVMYKYGLVCI